MSKRTEIIRRAVVNVFGSVEDPLEGLGEEEVMKYWRRYSDALAAPVIDAWKKAYPQDVPEEEIPKEDVNLFMEAWDSQARGS